MKACFGYIRVSTQKQGEGVSLEAQRDAITAFASRQNLNIIEWFEETETAAKSGRAVFNRMLKLLERGKAAGLVIHKIDRSARNLKDWAIISELSDKGVGVFFATETLDFQSRGGRLTADIQAVIAADYIRNLREETKKGIDGRLRQGLYPFRAPIGYLDRGKGQPKVPDPKKAHLIRELFDLYASGQHSLRSLRREMNKRGLRNLSDRPLSLNGVDTILRNTFYTGLITIVRTGMTYQGMHEPIVPMRVFKRAEDVRTGRYVQRVTKHSHLYRGLFRCGLCDAALTAELQKGHVYYRCQTTTCPTKTVREEGLTAAIEAALDRLQLTEEDTAFLEQNWTETDIIAEVEARRHAISLRVADENSRLERLTDLLIDGTIDNETFKERQSAARIRLIELTEDLERTNGLPEELDNHRKFLELMKSLVLLHRSGNSEEKRILVENCFSNRTVCGKYVELEPYNWLEVVKFDGGVPAGAPERDKDRIVREYGKGTPRPRTQLEPLFQLLERLNRPSFDGTA